MAVLDLTIAYDGAAYHGYARQLQEHDDGSLSDSVPTVQGEIERSLALVFRREVSTTCAGRTDAGVHARAQHVSFELDEGELEGMPIESLVRHLNGILPDDIVVRGVRKEGEGFSARFSAKSREYLYLLVDGPIRPVALCGRAWWVKRHLDSISMDRAAKALWGEHDFKSFCSADGAKDRNTVRTIESIEFARGCELGEDCIAVHIRGNAFLQNMVRIIVGTLADVGLGKRDQAWPASVLEACDRRAAGITAPACGLTLWDVEY